MREVSNVKNNCFYTVENGIAHLYVEIPTNPVLKKYTVFYEDGAISRDVSLALVDKTENIGEVENKYLNGLIKEIEYVNWEH